MSQLKVTNLANIADGVAEELFSHELKKLAANIEDPNTKAGAVRKITLTFQFNPDEDRAETRVTVQAKSSLAPIKPTTKTVWVGKKNGEPTVYGQDTQQPDLFDEDVRHISRERDFKKEAANDHG